jgi:rare lipoprotein A
MALMGCQSAEARPAQTAWPSDASDDAHGDLRRTGRQVGQASWYGNALAGHRTASGERFNPGGLTAAHPTLPFGTWVELRRVDTGERVRVRINDRGPFGKRHRMIDVSRGAAERLNMVKQGVVTVELIVLSRG